MQWLREPFFQCFLAGAALFALFFLVSEKYPARDAITLSQAGLETLVSDFEVLTGKTATDSDREMLVARFYRNEVLYREGIRREVYAEDGELRAQIVEAMRQRVSGILPTPDAEELVSFYADNIDRYYSEATLSFDQVLMLSKPEDPDLLIARLARGDDPESELQWRGKRFPDYGLSMVRGIFGQTQLAVLEALPMDEWHGPFESSDGWHFFRVSARRAPQLLPFERARIQVEADYRMQLLDRRMERFVEERGDQYPLQLLEP